MIRYTRLFICTSAIIVCVIAGVRWWRSKVIESNGQICISNVYQISFALELYNEHYGELPPVVVRDNNGKPLHSWRALILEFLDTPLRGQYHLSEPWDGPRNRLLHMEMPPYFKCPNRLGDSSTSYLAITKDDKFLSEALNTKRDIVDCKLVLVVEDHDRSVPWLKPEDIIYVPSPQAAAMQTFQSPDTRGPSVILSDFSVYQLGVSGSLSVEYLQCAEN